MNEVRFGDNELVDLLLRGVTISLSSGDKCEPFDMELIGAKISVDTNGNHIIESYKKAVILGLGESTKEEFIYPNVAIRMR